MSGSGNDSTQQGNGGTGDYEVGYGKPPASGRFRKGASGNPAGRPRKRAAQDNVGHASSATTLTHQMILEEAHRPVKVRQGDTVTEMSSAKAAFLGLQKNALAGSRLAQRDYLALVSGIEAAVQAEALEQFKALVTIKCENEQAIKLRQQKKLPIDDIFPHPDDIIVDPLAGWARCMGPLDAEDRKSYDQRVQGLASFQDWVTAAAQLHEAASKSKRPAKLDIWHAMQEAYDKLNDYLPPSLQRTMTDRSTAPGATEAGQFFQFTPEGVRAFVNAHKPPKPKR